MPNESTDTNPFAAPAASGTIEEAGRRTRWRVIPSTLLMVLGGCSLLSAPLYLISAYRHLGTNNQVMIERLYKECACSSLLGVFWLVSGILCFKGRWVWAALAAVAGFLSMAIGSTP